MSEYFDCDDFYGHSEFEQEIDHMKETLRASVKKEILDELNALRIENDELRLLKDHFEEAVRIYKDKCKQSEFEAERAIKNAEFKRFEELVSRVAPIAYCVDFYTVQRPKCDRCDEQRYVKFITPLGREMRERCTCFDYKKVYFVKKAPIVELHYRDREIPNTMHLVNPDGEDRFSMFSCEFEDEVPFEKINPWKVLFRDENRAKRYAAWMNAKEKEK